MSFWYHFDQPFMNFPHHLAMATQGHPWAAAGGRPRGAQGGRPARHDLCRGQVCAGLGGADRHGAFGIFPRNGGVGAQKWMVYPLVI